CRGKQDQAGACAGRGVERIVETGLGADGDAELDPRPGEYGAVSGGAEQFLSLAKVPLALGAEHLSGAREYLGDVRQAARGALGDAEAGADAAFLGGAGQCRDGRMIEGDQPLGAYPRFG